MADLSQQVRLQNELNEAIKERNSLLEQQNRLLSNQSDIAGKISKTVANPTATRRIRDMTNAIRVNNDAIEDGVDNAKELEDALDEAADAAESSSKSFNLLSVGFDALTGIMSGGISIFKNVGAAVMNIGASLLKTAFSIISFPFKLFGTLVDLAQQGGGGRPLAEAYEEVREVFGDLASGPGKLIISTFKEVRKEGRSLAGSGVSIRNIFGYGREGRAAMLKDLNEIGAAMGDNFHKLKNQFASMGSKNIVFQRGLGMSKEEYGELASLVDSRGQDMEKYLTDFGRTAVQTAKSFGIGVKDMAKGMKELNLDVESFGHLGPEAFAPITAYARKLGLEIKTMSGIMNKFSGFQDTTEAASRMAQEFGMNVDSMALMQAQNPAEKIDILRKSFFNAGNNLKDFNYQQRQYLSDLTDLKGKQLDAAFAADKQGISYSSIAKNAKKAQKSQKSQKEVLQDLGKGIKRLIQTMSGPKVKGFFDSFVKGFEKGILRSEDMRGVFKDIRHGLRQMRHFGIRVGKTFMKVFPGMKDMLGGLRDLLRPENFTQFISKLEPALEKFFKDQDFGSLVDNLSAAVGDGFGGSGKAVKRIASGLKSFLTASSKIIASFLGTVINRLVVPALEAFGSFMKEVEKQAEKEKGPFAGIKAIVKTLMKKIEDGLGSSELGKAIMDIIKPFSTLFSGKNSPISNLLAAYEDAAGPTSRVFKKIGKDLADALIQAIKDAFNSLSITDLLMGAGILGFMMNPIGFIGGAAKLGYNVTKGLYKGGMAAQAAMSGARGAKSSGLVGRMVFGRSKTAAIKSAEKAAGEVAEKTAKALGGPKGTKAFEKQFTTTYNNSMRTNLRNIENGTSKHLMRNNPFKPVGDMAKRFARKELPTALRAGAAIGRKGKEMKQFGQRVGTSMSNSVKAGMTSVKNTKGFQKAVEMIAKVPIPPALRAGAGFAKKIPIVGAFITTLFGGIEAIAAKEGEGTSTFISSVVSSLGFGVFDTAEVHDAFFSTSKKAAELYHVHGIKMRGAIQAEIDKMQPKLNEYASKIRGAQIDLANANQGFIDALAGGEAKFTDAEIAAETAARKARDARIQQGTDMVASAKDAGITTAEDVAQILSLDETISAQNKAGDTYISSITSNLGEMSKTTKQIVYQHFAGLKGAINALPGDDVGDMTKDFVLGAHGQIFINDDFFDTAEKIKLLNLKGLAKRIEASQGVKLDEANKFAANNADYLSDMKETTLKALLSSATKRGDQKMMGEAKREMERRARDMAVVDKDIIALVLEDVLPGENTAERKIKYEVALKKKQAEYLAKMSKVEDTAKEVMAKQRAKLTDLQMQKRMIEDIKSLEEIPKKLKAAAGVLDKYDPDVIKAQVNKLVGQGNLIIEAVEAGITTAGGVTDLSKGSKDAMTTINTVSKSVVEFAQSFDKLRGSLVILRGILKNSLFGGKNTASKLEGQIHDFAVDVIQIPEAIAEGLFLLLPASLGAGGEQSAKIDANIKSIGPKGPAVIRLKAITAAVTGFAEPVRGLTHGVDALRAGMVGMPAISPKLIASYSTKAAAGLNLVGKIVSGLDKESGFNDKITDPTMTPKLMIANVNLLTTAAVIQSLGLTLKATKKLTTAKLQKFKDIGLAINQAVTDIADAGNLVNTDNFEKVKPIVDGLANMGGGKINVSHNLPNAQIKLDVRINAKRFAKKLIETNLKTTAGDEQRIQVGDKKTVFPT